MSGTSLKEEAAQFANELQTLIRSVLTRNERTRVTSHTAGNLVVVRPGTDRVKQVKLHSNGQQVGSLSIDYKMEWNTRRRFLRVKASELKVLSLTNRPVVRLDFKADMNRAPVSHWNVHGESTELGRILRFKTDTRLSELHLSTGGVRFRPGLEDVLELAIDDLDIDAKKGWREVLHQRREQWRLKQLSAAIHDSPETAVRVLKDLDYKITLPGSGHPPPRPEHLRRS